MVEKYKLNLIVAFTILLITIWLIWARRVWDWTGYLLLLGAILLIMDTLIKKEKKPAKLLEFFIKSLVVCYVAVSIIWFIWLSTTSPQIYAYLDLELLMNMLIFNILPLSLFPVAISVIIYGIFRTKLKPWEIFLSSWYASMFVVFNIYSVWYSIYVRPYLPEFYYSSIAGAIAIWIGLVFLSFLITSIFTTVYLVLNKKMRTISQYLISTACMQDEVDTIQLFFFSFCWCKS